MRQFAAGCSSGTTAGRGQHDSRHGLLGAIPAFPTLSIAALTAIIVANP